LQQRSSLAWRTTLRSLLRTLRLLFAPIALASLIGFGWRARAMLEDVLASADIALLCLAVLAWSLMSLVAPLLATIVFRSRGADLSYGDAARIHILNLPARYIPGGIWHTVGRLLDLRQAGIGKADLAAFVLLENVLALALAFLIGGSLLAHYKGFQGWGLIAALAAGGGAILLVVLPFVARLRSRSEGSILRPRDYLSAVLVVAVSWCIAASAFVAFASGFSDLWTSTEILEIAGIYLFSWAVGFVAVFAPQGVGVFEVVAADLLRGSCSFAGIAALLATFRLVILLSDAAVWAIGKLLFKRRAQRTGTDTHGGPTESQNDDSA
jgi:hypothetical protein